MKTKETSPKQIYITVVTSGLTMLANKVVRVLQPNEDIFDACSELANDVAKENGLEWSNVLVQYFNHYSDEIPAMALKVPSKPKSTRSQALAWWKQLKSNVQLNYWRNYQKTTFTPNHSPNELTGREIEEIWRKETNLTTQVVRQAMKDVSHEVRFPKCVRDGLVKPNQKQFKTFDESLFKSYIDKFSKEDLQKASKILNDKILCDIFDVK